MARLLPQTSPMGQAGQRAIRTGLDLGPESGFFGREFTAKDLSDVFTLTQQGVGLIKEAEPIADYFSRKSKEADKQAALKEIADKRAKINAEKAAKAKAAQAKLREIGQQTAENRKLMGMMPEVPDVALQEPKFGSSLARPKGPSLREAPNIIENQISDDFLRLKNQGYDDVTASMIASVGRDTKLLPRPQTPMQLNVDIPGAVDPSAMLQDMTAQRQPVATERQPTKQERLVQAARQRVGAGPRGSQRLSDGTYRDPLDPNLVAAYRSLEESTGLPLEQMYAGSMPRYTPGTPDPVLPSEEALELLSARDLNTYRGLVRTPEEAALFNRLMDAAIKREGSDFMEEFETRDALEKELFKPFDFAAGQKPRKLDSGGFDIGEIRKARKDFIKANKGKGAKIKGRVKMPKVSEDLIANGVIAVERGTYQDGDNVVTSENAVTAPAYASYLKSLSEQGDTRPGLTKMFIRIAKRDEKGRRYVMDRLGITGLDAAFYKESMRAIKRRLAIWEKVTDKQINDAKKGAKLSATTKPGTIIRGTQGDKRIGQGDQRIDLSKQKLALNKEQFEQKMNLERDKLAEKQRAAGVREQLSREKFEQGVEQFGQQMGLKQQDRATKAMLAEIAVANYNRQVSETAMRNAMNAARNEPDEEKKLQVYQDTLNKSPTLPTVQLPGGKPIVIEAPSTSTPPARTQGTSRRTFKRRPSVR